MWTFKIVTMLKKQNTTIRHCPGREFDFRELGLMLRERDEFAELWMWNMLVFEDYTCELGK